MTNADDRRIAANYMGAVAHLLGGHPGRHGEFIKKVELILSGREPHAFQLMQFGDSVRRTGRPVIWIHHMHDVPNVPQIGLVALDGGRLHVIENCMLWMSHSDSRARLVPDNFTLGAFRFDDQLRLRHTPKAPARSFNADSPSMSRAYVRLRAIEAEQRERGDEFALPELAQAA
jgi:hypothetical protein